MNSPAPKAADSKISDTKASADKAADSKADKAADQKSVEHKPSMNTATDPAKKKALEAALDQIDKAYGKGSIMRLGQFEKIEVGSISTGSPSLDLAIGIGGVPRGRIVEVYGPESSGKTTLALSIAAQAQKEGGVVAFIDAEHALDPTWAERIGVKLDDLLVSQPNYGEQALDICDLLVRSNSVDVVVVDSVAALTPKAELDGEMEDSQVGVQARMMSKAMRKLTSAISQSKATVVFINQIREKIGVVYGSPETQPGGRALKFAASLRLDIRRVTSITEGEKAVGNRVRVKVVKNKVAAPFTKAEFDIMFNEGISYTGDLLDLAVLAKVAQKSGAWFTYGAVKLGQGRENSKQFLKDNPKIMNEIAAKVKAANLNLLDGPGGAADGE
jgi:recombination protein RecA